LTVWAISDLHLSFARPDSRERFGGRWREHAQVIERHWRETVGRDDLVLLPGDLSMARNHRDVQPDLEWLARLPGTKVLSPGNHDAWWNNVSTVRRLLRRSLLAVDGDSIVTRGAVICGARGCEVPTDDAARGAETREVASLDRALAHARELRGADMPLFVLWHYPPFDAYGRPGAVVELLEHERVTVCVYGHLHIQAQWALAAQGVVNGVRYYCVAADAIGFRPLRIAELTSPSQT
jgi:predicted phosphohydrolase